MEYKELSKLYHVDASSSRDAHIAAELEVRRNAESTFRIGFDTPNGELFLAMPRELTVLNELVLKNERAVSELLGGFPEIAQRAVLRGMVLDEVVCTNTIENVRSTRRQVKDALDAAEGGTAKDRRFKELARLYLGIADGKGIVPHSAADIRAIYDKVTAGEIPSDKQPDGRLFRKEGVDITAGGVRVVHRGVEPETKIIEAMEKMLSLINDEGIPALYSAIASHYIFEYAHPFYDGNGRTGRYLLSLYLSRVLSTPTAISLSRTIAEHKEAYYRAFGTVEAKLNHAELTFFVYAMLDLIRIAQSETIARLGKGASTLGRIDDIVQSDAVAIGLKGKESEVVRLLLQYQAFGLLGDASVQEVADYLGVGKQQARKYLAALERRGVCEKRNGYDPVTFGLTKGFCKRCGVDFAEDSAADFR